MRHGAHGSSENAIAQGQENEVPGPRFPPIGENAEERADDAHRDGHADR